MSRPAPHAAPGTASRSAAKDARSAPPATRPLPWLVDAGDDDFASATETSQLVLVDLWAPWCGPCRMVAPILERLAGQYAGRVKVVKVNVDDNPGAAHRFDAQSIPTLVMLRDGATVTRLVGAQPEPVLRQHIDALLTS